MSWLDEHALSVYSQNGEDGIIAHIFSVIGHESHLFIEFGFSVPECNSWRLVEEEGFGGLFIDKSDVCAALKAKLAAQERINVRVVRESLTVENIEEVLSWMPAEIDMMSIDVDGNDYWLWKAIERTSPRLVVIEFNKALGPDISVTIPYDPDFSWACGSYFGASLRALARLGKLKGYKLIGCEPIGVNAFFLRNDIDGFDAVDPSDAFAWGSCGWDGLKELAWVEI